MTSRRCSERSLISRKATRRTPDLYTAAAEHVRSTRSAGVETHEANSFHMRPGAEATTQLRYRSEMADLFTDLAIDVGLRRHHQEPVAAA